MPSDEVRKKPQAQSTPATTGTAMAASTVALRLDSLPSQSRCTSAAASQIAATMARR